MKTEKQLLLDELDSCMTKFDGECDSDSFLKTYSQIVEINSKLGLVTPPWFKLFDRSKIQSSVLSKVIANLD